MPADPRPAADPSGTRAEPDDGEQLTRELLPPGERANPAAIRERLMTLSGRGGGQYLEVKWRLLWLRGADPDALVETEPYRVDDAIAMFRARVTLTTGGVGCGFGTETPADFGDYVEKAETKAIGRALAALGFGTQFVADHDFANGARPGARPQVVDAPSALRPPPSSPSGTPLDAPSGTAVDVPTTTDRPAYRADLPDPRADWNAFWPWARSRNLAGPREVERLIGRPTAGLTPAQLHDAIVAAPEGGGQKAEGGGGGSAVVHAPPAQGDAPRPPPQRGPKPGGITEKQMAKLWASFHEKWRLDQPTAADALHAIAASHYEIAGSLWNLAKLDASQLIDDILTIAPDELVAVVAALLRDRAIDRGQTELPGLPSHAAVAHAEA